MATVTNRMTRRDRMDYIDLAEQPPESVSLVELIDRLEGRDWKRVPILDCQNPKYVVHVSVIDRFMRHSALAGKDISTLTLADVLADQESAHLFENTFGIIETGQTIAEAILAMRNIPGCEDVFVTDGDGSVVGWSTDRDVPVDELRTL